MAFFDKHGLKDYYMTDGDEISNQQVLCLVMHWICETNREPMRKVHAMCAAVKFYFTSHGNAVGFLSGPLVTMTKTALTRTAVPSLKRPREPATYDMVKHVRQIRWVEIMEKNEELDKARSMMEYLGIALAFNFMMRVSEYTLGVHALMHDDVWFVGNQPFNRQYSCTEIREKGVKCGEIRLINFIIRTSKTDQPGSNNVGRKVSLEADTDVEKQLVNDLVTWCEISGVKQNDQFLSRWFNGKNKRLRSNEVTIAIKEAATFFNLDKDQFMSHSLRLGGITAKCRAGCNPSETRKVAGYKNDSKVMDIYNRINTHDKGALASIDESVSHDRVTALNLVERQRKTGHINQGHVNSVKKFSSKR